MNKKYVVIAISAAMAVSGCGNVAAIGGDDAKFASLLTKMHSIEKQYADLSKKARICSNEFYAIGQQMSDDNDSNNKVIEMFIAVRAAEKATLNGISPSEKQWTEFKDLALKLDTTHTDLMRKSDTGC